MPDILIAHALVRVPAIVYAFGNQAANIGHDSLGRRRKSKRTTGLWRHDAFCTRRVKLKRLIEFDPALSFPA